MRSDEGRATGTFVARARRVLQWLFVSMLFLMLLPQGSVNYLPFHLAAVVLFTTAALAALVSPAREGSRAALGLSVSIAVVLGAWILIQAAGLPNNPLSNPIWSEVERIYGPVAKSISVAPGDTLQGLIAALLPFAIFATALLLFGSDAESLWLVKAIVLPGLALTVIGLVQFQFFPDMLLFERKHIYLRSLTIVFVNPNTAATYLATLLIFTTGLAFHALQNAGLREFASYLLGARSMTRPVDARAAIFYGIGAAVVLAALMLTRSRAGVASGILGLIVLSVTLAYYGTQRRHVVAGFSRRRTSKSKRMVRIALVVAAVLVVGGAFSSQVVMRAQVQGSNDLRFCFMPGLIEMARDNWLTGTGFGTFRQAFPAYRDPTCGLDGVLARAHDFYLEAWITLGLPFIVLASAVVVIVLCYLIHGIRVRRQYRWIPAAGLGVLLVQILHNSIDFSIQIPAVAAIFVALTGASVSVATGRNARTAPAPSTTKPAPATFGTNSPFG